MEVAFLEDFEKQSQKTLRLALISSALIISVYISIGEYFGHLFARPHENCIKAAL